MEEEISIPIAERMSDPRVVPVPDSAAFALSCNSMSATFSPLGSPYADTGQKQDLPCGFRFHAAGREDVDVRMLGDGESSKTACCLSQTLQLISSTFATDDAANFRSTLHGRAHGLQECDYPCIISC